jgi:hypothetical protein
MWETFWSWYERTYALNISLALGLFLLQLIHLVWLFGEVMWAHLTGTPLFTFTGIAKVAIVAVDYTEIPALVSVSFIYINELRKKFAVKDLLFLVFLNSQWLHLFWITDEFVVGSLSGEPNILPLWLAWVAILIDYLELPVMADTIRKFFKAWGEHRVGNFLRHELS